MHIVRFRFDETTLDLETLSNDEVSQRLANSQLVHISRATCWPTRERIDNLHRWAARRLPRFKRSLSRSRRKVVDRSPFSSTVPSFDRTRERPPRVYIFLFFLLLLLFLFLLLFLPPASLFARCSLFIRLDIRWFVAPVDRPMKLCPASPEIV